MAETARKNISVDTFSWYVFFVCGVVVPMLGGIVYGNLISSAVNSLGIGIFSEIISAAFSLVVLWCGIKYYIGYAQNKYVLSGKKKLVKNVMITFIAWSLLGLILIAFVDQLDVPLIIVSIVLTILEMVVVYTALNRYLVIK